MKKNRITKLLKQFILGLPVLCALAALTLCIEGCSKDEETKEYYRFYVYRQAALPIFERTIIGDRTGQPVHFTAFEVPNVTVAYKYEVYNQDYVDYHGLKDATPLSGFDQWFYIPSAIDTIGVKTEKGKFTLDNGTVLKWGLTGDHITSLTDQNGNLLYVGWDPKEELSF